MFIFNCKGYEVFLEKFLTLPLHKLYYGLGTTAGFPKLWRTAEPASILRKYSTSASLKGSLKLISRRVIVYSVGAYITLKTNSWQLRNSVEKP